MKAIYDNGEMLLGNVKDIIKYTEEQAEKGIVDEEFKNDVIEDLVGYSEDTIVTINYDNGMGYSIDYWDDRDIVKEIR